jgi:8-oxo-dGTP pyrophosphatase MutT (NUDIX family)
MNRKSIVTSFLQKDEKILICWRSDKVGTYKGEWAAISGHLEEKSPLAQAKREIREETGLEEKDLLLIKEGEPMRVDDIERDLYWRVYPFLFKITSDRELKLNYEHTECKWIKPQQLKETVTVPKLYEAWERINFD